MGGTTLSYSVLKGFLLLIWFVYTRKMLYFIKRLQPELSSENCLLLLLTSLFFFLFLVS